MSGEKKDNSNKHEGNPIVLDYGDYVLRQSDVDLLTNNQWLNDVLIGFYFNYLNNQYGTVKDCMYIGPEVAQLVKMMPVDQVEPIIADLKDDLASKKFIFIAVNDSENPDAHSSGSHWSLLVYSRHDNLFVHLDSSSDFNYENAKAIKMKLGTFITTGAQMENLQHCKRQVNGRDCGLHVICSALKISQLIADKTSVDQFVTSDPVEAFAMRKDLVTLIGSLANK